MELNITPEAAHQCAAALDRFVDGLNDVAHNTEYVGWTKGFGTLPSGIALAAKYTDLTVGPENSLASMIIGHIAAAEKLREAFLAAGRGYEDTDAATTTNITGIGPR